MNSALYMGFLSSGLVAFPDSDFVLGLINGQFYLKYHRDFTHSLILIPFYALFFGWVFVKLSKRPYFWSFYKICLPVLASHVLLDLFTSYGTMIFSPFFENRYAWDLIFIIDLIFSGIAVFPFVASFLWKRKSPWVCRGSLIVLTLYVLFCWMLHERALELTKTFARSLDEEVLKVASMPQPASPFRWANYIETEDKVYQGFVDLLKKEPLKQSSQPSSFFGKLNSLYYPPGKIAYKSWVKFPDSAWVKKALQTNGAKFYYRFARLPVVRSVNSTNGTHRVEFMDVRFLGCLASGCPSSTIWSLTIQEKFNPKGSRETGKNQSDER